MAFGRSRLHFVPGLLLCSSERALLPGNLQAAVAVGQWRVAKYAVLSFELRHLSKIDSVLLANYVKWCAQRRLRNTLFMAKGSSNQAPRRTLCARGPKWSHFAGNVSNTGHNASPSWPRNYYDNLSHYIAPTWRNCLADINLSIVDGHSAMLVRFFGARTCKVCVSWQIRLYRHIGSF